MGDFPLQNPKPPVMNPGRHSSGTPLKGSDAVAGLIVLDDGRYLMQHRDDSPHIWYPGYWGCFGGAVDVGEDPVAALRRELFEELEFTPRVTNYFTRFDFDLAELRTGRFYRMYYVIPMNRAEQNRTILHEGQKVEAFSGETILNELRLTPYDAFALFLYHNRDRLSCATNSRQLAHDRHKPNTA